LVVPGVTASAQLRPLSDPLPPRVPSWSFDENDHSPDWAPDGARIMLTRWSPTRSYQLYVVDTDGSNLRQLTSGPGNNQQGTFSPSGDRIAFLSDRDGTWAIYVMNSDGTSLARLTHDSASVGERPGWSPDGQHIAYYSNRNGHLDIWVTNADGTNHVALTNDSVPDWNPAWSPDGRFIAFDRNEGDREVWAMQSDGTNLRRLTRNEGYDGYPAWSPDGLRIAFIAVENDIWSVYTMYADGSDRRQLTNSPEWNFDPEWSPDGRQIVFDSRRDGRRGTYIMNADGSNEQKITNIETSEFVAVARAQGAAEAVRRYRAAIIAMPDATFFLPTELEILAQEFISMGQMPDAALLLETAIEHQPQYSGVIDELREVHLALGRTVPPTADSILAVFREAGVSEGLTLLTELSFRFPNWPVLSSSNFNAIADDVSYTGNHEDVIRVVRVATAKYPDRPDYHRRLGELYLAAGDSMAGIKHLERAAELAPDDVAIRRLLDAQR
jgi:TolB protein